jgi:hypothetical protein
MTHELEVGNRVEWNSEVGRVRETIKKKRRKSGAAAALALSQLSRCTGCADEEQNQWTADGSWSTIQQTKIANGKAYFHHLPDTFEVVSN